MVTPSYEQIIQEGIKGLPPDTLAEIAHFVFFMRKRTLQPKAFEADLFETMLHAELTQLDSDEQRHLEEEFADYDKRYPRK